MSSEPFRSFRQLVIPREIWLHPELSLVDKAVWSEIFSLHCFEKGGCYAKDEYLMKFFDLGKTRVQEILKKLRDLQLLETVHSDGRERIMRAIPPAIHYGGDQIPGKPGTTSPENRVPPIPTPYNREEIDDKSVGASAPPVPVSCTPKKKKRAPEVSTTDEEHERLCKEFGTPKVERFYKELSDWKLNTPKSKWKLNDNLTIRKWVIEAVREKDLKNPVAVSSADADKNKVLFESLKDGPYYAKAMQIVATPQGIAHKVKSWRLSWDTPTEEFKSKLKDICGL